MKKKYSNLTVSLSLCIYSIQINRSQFGLSRKFLLQGMEHAFVKAYYEFMVDAAVIFGAHRSNAEIEFLDVLQFEMELAKVVFNLRDIFLFLV